MHFEDLTPCTYFGATPFRLLAIGWLSRSHEFTRGAMDRATYDALGRLLIKPWTPAVFAGFHECDLCQFGGERGAENVFIPGRDAVYVAPSLVRHYINAHRYQPPREFQDAVLSCPEMRSMTYLRELRRLGVTLQGFDQE